MSQKEQSFGLLLLGRGSATQRCFAALALALFVGASRPRAGCAGRAPLYGPGDEVDNTFAVVDETRGARGEIENPWALWRRGATGK